MKGCLIFVSDRHTLKEGHATSHRQSRYKNHFFYRNDFGVPNINESGRKRSGNAWVIIIIAALFLPSLLRDFANYPLGKIWQGRAKTRREGARHMRLVFRAHSLVWQNQAKFSIESVTLDHRFSELCVYKLILSRSCRP